MKNFLTIVLILLAGNVCFNLQAVEKYSESHIKQENICSYMLVDNNYYVTQEVYNILRNRSPLLANIYEITSIQKYPDPMLGPYNNAGIKSTCIGETEFKLLLLLIATTNISDFLMSLLLQDKFDILKNIDYLELEYYIPFVAASIAQNLTIVDIPLLNNTCNPEMKNYISRELVHTVRSMFWQSQDTKVVTFNKIQSVYFKQNFLEKAVSVSADGKTIVSICSHTPQANRDALRVCCKNEDTSYTISYIPVTKGVSVDSVYLSADGQVIIPGDNSNYFKIFTLLNGNKEYRNTHVLLDQPQGYSINIDPVSISADGYSFALSINNEIRVYKKNDLYDYYRVPKINVPTYGIRKISLNMDHNTIVLHAYNKNINVYKVGKNGYALSATFDSKYHKVDALITLLEISTDAKTIVLVLKERELRIYTCSEDEYVLGSTFSANCNNAGDDTIDIIIMSSDGTTLVTGSKQGRLAIYKQNNDDTSDLVNTFDKTNNSTTHKIDLIALSADGKTIAVKAHDESIMLYTQKR